MFKKISTTKITIAIIFILFFIWLGYRLRLEEDGIKAADNEADIYFDSIKNSR